MQMEWFCVMKAVSYSRRSLFCCNWNSYFIIQKQKNFTAIRLLIFHGIYASKMEFMRWIGLTLLYLEKKLQTFTSKTLGIDIVPMLPVKESFQGRRLTLAVENDNQNAVGSTPGKVYIQVLVCVAW
jgi:hypothetical protein